MGSSVSVTELCREQKWEKAKKLIQKNPKRYIYKERLGVQGGPAHYAAKYGNLDMLKFMHTQLNHVPKILERKIWRPFACGRNDLPTPLALAITHGHFDCVKWFIGTIYLSGEVFTRPLYAGRYDLTETCETYAHLAAHLRRMKELMFIVEVAPTHGAVLEVKDRIGNTPVHLSNCTPETLEYFVRKAPSGIEILNMKNDRGQTPLDIGDFLGTKASEHFTPEKLARLNREIKQWKE